MNRGFLISAQNTVDVNYISCAETLAESIKRCMPDEKVVLLTDQSIKSAWFDHVIIYPWGDTCLDDGWKLANDWQVYGASPFDYTIKLEADLYIPRRIDHWWSILETRDLVISTGIHNYSGEMSSSRAYRKIFDDNRLPDVYNAITYFKKSQLASSFYETVRNIFENWRSYKAIIKCNDGERATTDLVYAIAATIHGVENCTLPDSNFMSMVHMKPAIAGTKSYDWTNELLYELTPWSLRIGTIPQMWPVHYHIKNFAEELMSELRGFRD